MEEDWDSPINLQGNSKKKQGKLESWRITRSFLGFQKRVAIPAFLFQFFYEKKNRPVCTGRLLETSTQKFYWRTFESRRRPRVRNRPGPACRPPLRSCYRHPSSPLSSVAVAISWCRLLELEAKSQTNPVCKVLHTERNNT